MKWRKGLYVLSTLIFVFVLLLHFDAYEVFIFRGKKLPQQHRFQFSFPFQEFTFQANDGGSINAILLNAPKPAKGLILYFHGNKDNLDRWANEAHDLCNFGYDVMVYDYRGYGKSKGERNEATFYGDAWLLYQQCAKMYPKDSILIYGRSLGTGTASWLAANAKVKALLLETPYTDMVNLIENQVLGFPMHWFLNYKFDNLAQLSTLNLPVFIIHGTNDQLISADHARKLASVCTHPASQLIIIANGGHNNLRSFDTYQKSLEQFLSSIRLIN